MRNWQPVSRMIELVWSRRGAAFGAFLIELADLDPAAIDRDGACRQFSSRLGGAEGPRHADVTGVGLVAKRAIVDVAARARP